MNLSSTFKLKYKENKEHIIQIKEEEDEVVSNEPVQPIQRRASNRYVRSRNNSKANVKKPNENEDKDEEDGRSSSSSINNPNMPRVDRFLSIVEIPPEILWLTQQKFAQKFQNMPEVDETKLDEVDDEKLVESNVESAKKGKKHAKKTNKLKTDKNKAGSRSFRDGSTLTQEVKAQIIKDIIRNYDLDLYIKEAKARDVVQIEYKKNDTNARPVRNRIMKLMKSDVIRINDGDYMRELSKRIQKTYEEKQDKLMQDLEERERKRERKLKLKGLLTKTSEEEEEEKKLKFNSDSLKSNKLRKNSNLLDPITNLNTSTMSTSFNTSSTNLNLGKLPKLNK